MAVVFPDHEVVGHMLPDQECFYCHNPFDGVAIWWMGHPGDIWIHPGCVFSLAVRMFRDVHEWEISGAIQDPHGEIDWHPQSRAVSYPRESKD